MKFSNSLLATVLLSIASAAPAYTVTAAAPSVTVNGPAATATATVPATPALCNNAGLQWAYYQNSRFFDGVKSSYDWDPAVVKRMTPQAQGTTAYVGSKNNNGAAGPIYNSTSAPPGTNYVVNHRGYLLALETGIYTFNATNVDDILALWIGSQAYSGWGNSNAQQRTLYTGGPGYGVYYQRLTAGEFYPIRLVFAQGNGGALFGFSITSPSGAELLNGDSSSQGSPSIMQFSCDGKLAPQYSAFGQET